MRPHLQKIGALAIWRGASGCWRERQRGLGQQGRAVIQADLIDCYGLADAVVERNEDMRVR